MSEPIAIQLGFPLGGIHKGTGFHDQQPQTTPSCLNVWPYQWSTGRARGGVRPGLTSISGHNFPGATPHNWCNASWDGGDGVAVTTSTGTYVSTDGTWTQRIGTAPGSTFSSPAVYNSVLFQASANSATVKQYNLATGGTVEDLTVETYPGAIPKGAVPTYCGLVLGTAGRLILAGDANNPHVIYMSRVDNYRDFDYSKTDIGAAYASSGETGKINKPIIALLDHGNDCLLVGHVDGISVIVGNMRGGGEIVRTEQQIGPLMQSAWCKIGSGHTVMLTREGLYAIPAGCARDITCEMISDQLPNDLVGIDPGLTPVGDTASLVYDGRFHGIHIYVDRASGGDAHYFFDLKHKGFFPMSFAVGTLKLGVPLPKIASATKSGVIALRTSAAYQFHTASSESIESHCYFPPIALGSGLTEGILTELSATLSEDANQSVSWEIYADQSPQQAFSSATPKFTGTAWTKSGFNHWSHPRVRGQAAYVKVSGTGSSRWCIEDIVGTAYPVSKRRRAS